MSCSLRFQLRSASRRHQQEAKGAPAQGRRYAREYRDARNRRQELDEVKCEAAVAAVGASDSGPSAACPCYNMKSAKPDQPMLC